MDKSSINGLISILLIIIQLKMKKELLEEFIQMDIKLKILLSIHIVKLLLVMISGKYPHIVKMIVQEIQSVEKYNQEII